MSAVLITRPDVRTSSRMRTVATWLFVLPLFAEGVLPGVVKLEVAGLGLLAFASIVILQRPIPPRALTRIYLTFAVLALILIAYLAFRPWPQYFGTARSYDKGAAIFIGTWVAAAVFAVHFFEQELFERVVWRAATLTLWVGLVTCVFSRATSHLVLVNAANGGLRMYGTMSEPSAWAPVLTIIMLLALRRRAWLYVALAIAGLLLADSPTCLLVMAVTLPLYFALTSGWRHRAVLLVALAIVIPAGALFVQHANQQAWLDSSNPAKVAVGRLLSGISSVETGGQEGSNVRFTGTTEIIADMRDNGWMLLGAGPSADTTYFPARYPGGNGTTALEPNALWVSVLFDLGEAGVLVLCALMVAAVARMRRSPAMAAILLPYFVATLVNSGGTGTTLVILGIMLFAFGWGPQRAGIPQDAYR